MVLTLGIDSSVLHAPVFLATWDDCGEMDYSAFIASWGLISAQQACVCWGFTVPFNCSGCGVADRLLWWAHTLTDQFLTQILCFFAGCYNLEARFMPELPLPWQYRYLQTCCLQKPSVCL